jgi:hypothetical protein
VEEEGGLQGKVCSRTAWLNAPRICSALPILIAPISHLAVADEVGADVHPWPGQPMTPLGGADEVGADVHPWPGQPMSTLDEHGTTEML